MPPTLTDREFVQFQRFIFEAAGITMSASKKALVGGRLAKRVQHYQLNSYSDYFKLLAKGDSPQEVQMALSEDDAKRLFDRLKAEAVHLFYVKTAVEFGTLGEAE